MQRLLIIEHSSDSSRIGDTLAAEGLFACERANWDSVSPDNVDLRGIELLLAIVVPATPSAIELLKRFCGNRAVPTLAVFPSDTEFPILQNASEVVDDFMLWPFHPTELVHRIGRLLGNGNSIKLESAGVTITASGKVTVNASTVAVSAGMVTVDAGMSKFSGVVQADTVICNSIVSASYTPGAGNIW